MVAQVWHKCQFFRLLEVIIILNFCPAYKFEIKEFKSILRHIHINHQHIWSRKRLLAGAEND